MCDVKEEKSEVKTEESPSILEGFIDILEHLKVDPVYIEHFLNDTNVRDAALLTEVHQLHAISFYYLKLMFASEIIVPMPVRYAILHKTSPAGWLENMAYSVIPYFYENIDQFIKLED